MGCCGQKGLDVFEYTGHKHRLVLGNINHSNCEICNDDIPAGFSYFCKECNFNICIECKKKEEVRQIEEAKRKAEEDARRKEEEEKRRKEEEERKRKEEEAQKAKTKKKRNLNLEQ